MESTNINEQSLNEITILPHIKKFWDQMIKNWSTLYEAITIGSINDKNKAHGVINWFLGEQLSKCIDIELTLNEINRTEFEKATGLVELYVSPRIKKSNILAMNLLVDSAPLLPNMAVYRYKAYNEKDPIIANIEYEDHVVNYDDMGCQITLTYDEEKKPLLNLVIYVKKPLADKILEKKKVTFILQDGSQTELEKWLPTKTSAVDIFLLNIIGEYNVIHNLGYVEFLPEGDPLIAEGSVFTELSDLRGKITLLEKMNSDEALICNTCDRKHYQAKLLVCANCKQTKYCSKLCQKIDYPAHKKFCSYMQDF
jgi:hypothetical protein